MLLYCFGLRISNFLEGAWLLLTEPMFEFSRSAHRQVEVADGKGRGRWEFGVEVSRFVVTVVSS